MLTHRLFLTALRHISCYVRHPPLYHSIKKLQKMYQPSGFEAIVSRCGMSRTVKNQNFLILLYSGLRGLLLRCNDHMTIVSNNRSDESNRIIIISGVHKRVLLSRRVSSLFNIDLLRSIQFFHCRGVEHSSLDKAHIRAA